MPTKPEALGKRIRAFFCKDENNDGVWQCRCGKKRKVTGSGYTNLTNHVKELHRSEYLEAINEATTILEASSINSPSARTLSHTSGISQPFLWKKTTCRLHGWFQYTIHNLRPFNSCENLDVFRHIKHETISQKTLLKYVENLTELVEKKLSQLLPEKFALILDGWSTTNTHYIGIMAIFRSENTNGYSSVLLGLSPLENEETQCANEHYDLLNYVLGIYGKGVANVVALIGDNRGTNRSLSRLFFCSFVGCASYRFNLAVKDCYHTRISY